MSITKAMWTGVSGLGAEGGALGVIGDNIANGNTVGFKASRALFEDILGGAIGSNLGGGVRLARTQQIFGQGSIVNTGQATDLAISGDGFFVVKGALGGVTGEFYSRAGQFTPDNQGFLVNPQGLKLQGYGVNPDGTISSKMGDIQLPTTPIPAKPTSMFELQAKLDPAAVPPALPFDPNNPGTTSNHSAPMTVVDSLGTSHQVDVYFVKTAAGWDYHVVASGDEITGGPAGQQMEIGAPGGTLTFNTDGGLATQSMASVSFDFVGATPGQA
ncbi:MAG: flagellar hook-basal body complex protein, partial [Myxococcales bacterium]|nr:flagellar hook-basal body complex protein [Myxococcales bacterium]